MRYPSIRLLAWIALIIGMVGCKDDPAEPADPIIPSPYVSLNYDGSNQDAPILPANSYNGAVRMTAAELAPYLGKTVRSVWYYIKEAPNVAELQIFQGSNADSLVYGVGVTAAINAESWNEHVLAQPLTITGAELWVGIAFTTFAEQRTLGCDEGPAVTNGDWLWDQSDGLWLPLRQRSAVDINWNIRLVIDPT